jgi:hypothetical protein
VGELLVVLGQRLAELGRQPAQDLIFEQLGFSQARVLFFGGRALGLFSDRVGAPVNGMSPGRGHRRGGQGGHRGDALLCPVRFAAPDFAKRARMRRSSTS